MSIPTETILNASQCIYNWLEYLSKASENSKLIAESSLKYPFIESLERHSINNVHLEFLHPLFKGKRIDAYIGNVQDINKTDESLPQMIFIEFKFVRGDTLSKKEQERYFNDIMRLKYLKQRHHTAECFLLVCGESISFYNAFIYNPKIKADKKIKENKKGVKRNKYKSIYNEWLSFNAKIRKKNINTTKRKYNNFISSFKEEYLSLKRENVQFEIEEKPKIITELKLLLPTSKSIDNSYSLGLWEIL